MTRELVDDPALADDPELVVTRIVPVRSRAGRPSGKAIPEKDLISS
jgi:hypothetical protein